MPWTESDAKKKNRHATGKAGKQWKSVANAVLEKTGDEARAIKTASGVIKKRRMKRKHGRSSGRT